VKHIQGHSLLDFNGLEKYSTQCCLGNFYVVGNILIIRLDSITLSVAFLLLFFSFQKFVNIVPLTGRTLLDHKEMVVEGRLNREDGVKIQLI
jgi:hypothetical protein